jgi:glycosyltransferase involved in cell wall biosynthesis
LEPDPPDPGLAAQNYFVTAGAIEPRKNHLLLLRVWRDLIERLGTAAPKLVIVGSPAQGAGAVLEAIAPLASHVVQASGLSTQGLRRLIRSSRALLMPSWAEGFGLPVQEALALGRPVIASDIPAHREIGAGLPLFLPPDRDDLWLEAILNPPEAGVYAPMQAADYFRAVAGWLHEY